MIAAGQLTGLVGTYAVLVELLLMSRIGWLERHLGFDRLAVWHRWVGFASVALLSAHAVCITLGYATEGGQSIPAQLGDFVQHYPDVLMAIVGFGLFVAVAVTSVRAARRAAFTGGLVRVASVRLPGGRALVRAPARSGDGLHRRSARPDLVERPLRRRVRRHPRVAGREADRVQPSPPTLGPSRATPRRTASCRSTSAGRDLDRVGAQPGQFFLWRFLTGQGWARAHPFSLSAAPDQPTPAHHREGPG